MTTKKKIDCIVGLGNPGDKYHPTRHNAGAWFVQALAEQYAIELKPERKFFGRYGKWQHDQGSCHILMPDTYMNESGKAVSALAKFFKITPESILVAHDELDLAPGIARLKQGGGHGGHNGLRDIIAKCGSNHFMRLRLGIGHPGNAKLVHDYVLHKPSNADKCAITGAVEETLAHMPLILQGEFDKAMTALHTKEKE